MKVSSIFSLIVLLFTRVSQNSCGQLHVKLITPMYDKLDEIRMSIICHWEERALWRISCSNEVCLIGIMVNTKSSNDNIFTLVPILHNIFNDT